MVGVGRGATFLLLYSAITFIACVGKVKFTVQLYLLRVWEK